MSSNQEIGIKRDHHMMRLQGILNSLLFFLVSLPVNADVIFDNGGPDPSRFGSPSDQGATSHPRLSADDFALSDNSNIIGGIHWWGVFGANVPYTDDFRIFFIPGDGGIPAQDVSIEAVFQGEVTRTDSGMNDGVGNDIYAYSVSIEPQVIPAGQPYWLNIVNHSPTSVTSWGWSGNANIGNYVQALPPGFIWAEGFQGGGELAFNLTYTSPLVFRDGFETQF
jgi:hypothetical protein